MSAEPTHEPPAELADRRATELDMAGLSDVERSDQTCPLCLQPYLDMAAAIDCERIHGEQREQRMSYVFTEALRAIGATPDHMKAIDAELGGHPDEADE